MSAAHDTQLAAVAGSRLRLKVGVLENIFGGHTHAVTIHDGIKGRPDLRSRRADPHQSPRPGSGNDTSLRGGGGWQRAWPISCGDTGSCGSGSGGGRLLLRLRRRNFFAV